MTGIIFFVIFYILAASAGCWGDVILSKCKAAPSLIFRMAFGGCAVIFTGMTVCFAGSLVSLSVNGAMAAFAFVITIICVTGIFYKKRYGGFGSCLPEGIRACDMVYATIAAVMIGIQICAVIRFRYEGVEPLRNVGVATAVFESGHLFPSDPMMLFVGMLSGVLSIHPLKLICLILPAPLILLYYLCYIEVIDTVCAGISRIVALIAVVMLNVWGYQSDLLADATLLLSWSGIWVFIIHGLLNIAAVILIRYLEGRPRSAKENIEEQYDDLEEEWDMKKHKIINARNLAIALGVLAAALATVVFVLNSKINRLYDATVNLQEDLNSRVSVYEFVPSGDDAEGFLLRGSDGRLSFIGGGSSENTDELKAFLARYGNSIENWYIYDNDEENAGAVKELLSSKEIDIGKVYVIKREEMTGP